MFRVLARNPGAVFALLLSGFLLNLAPVRAATRLWTGALNTNWAASRNWSNNVLPKTDDVLVFPPEAANRSTWNLLTLSYTGIQMEGDYSVGGSPIKVGSLFGYGFININAPVNFRRDGDAGGDALFLNGRTTIDGSLFTWGAVSAAGTITGNGSLIVRGNLSLSQTNSYDGGTLIRSNGLVSLSNQATLGASNAPVTIEPFGTLELRSIRPVTQPVTVSGFGRKTAGAAIVALAQAKIANPLILAGDTLVTTAPTTATSLALAGAVPTPNAPNATLIKAGIGELRLLATTNQFLVPVRMTQGNFFLVPDLAVPRQPTWPGPVFLRDLVVGSPTNFLSLVCDVMLPRVVSPGQVLPNFVFGPEAAVTVHSNATLVAGPRQQGLGNPLTLNGGVVRLLDLTGQALSYPQGEHTGEIRITGRVESAIEGWLNVTNEVVVSSTNNAPLRFGGSRSPQITAADSRITGDRLVLDGVRARFAGASANHLTNLVLLRGDLSLAKTTQLPAAARTNIIGTADPAALPATLRVLGQQQFPSQAQVEVLASGSLVVTRANTLGRLLLSGGKAELVNTAVDALELGAGAELRFTAVSAASYSLSVNRISARSPDVAGTVVFPATLLSGTPLTLAKLAGEEPFPLRFNGLPQGGTLTNQGTIYRLNYAGGDGNDLVLETVAPPQPPQLKVTFDNDGGALLSWPESGFGCQLYYQTFLDPAGGWHGVTTPPAVNGVFSHYISPASGPTSIFYRLICP